MSKLTGLEGRRKQRLAQITPTGREAPAPEEESDSEEFELDETDDVIYHTKKEIPLIQKIDSSNPDERHWAMGSLSRLVVEDPNAFTLVSDNQATLASLVKSLFDSNAEVAISAAGLLRNLTSVGNPQVCEKIIDADCLTALVAILGAHLPKLKALQANPISEEDEDMTNIQANIEKHNQLTANSLILFTNLCEFSSKATDRFKTENLIEFAFQMLAPNAVSHDIAICIADLLNIVTEDNEQVLQQFSAEKILGLKMIVANQKASLHLRVALSSVLCNVVPVNDPSLLNIILITLSDCLSFDNTALFNSILQQPADAIDHSVLPFQEWSQRSRAQVLALETLTNILATDTDSNDLLPQQLSSAVVSSGICNKVLPLGSFLETKILDLQKRPEFNYLEDIFATATVVQATALGCLNNIILGLPTNGDIQALYNGLWIWCGIAFSSENQINDEIKLMTVSCIRSLLQKISIVPEAWQAEAAFKLAAHPIEKVRCHSVAILGAYAKTSVGPQIALSLGNLLMQLLSDESSWVQVEVFDVIFGVFDDLFDDVIAQVNMLQKMKEFFIFLKQKITRPEVVSDPLLQCKLDEILTNINPFLEYKRKQQKKK